MEKILVGNAFPLSLVRHGDVRMSCRPLSELRTALKGRAIVSFWGHENTRRIAERLLGVSLKPSVARPALRLAADGRPMLDGETFGMCWVLSPDYRDGGRPQIGQEVAPEQISGWQVVRVSWEQT